MQHSTESCYPYKSGKEPEAVHCAERRYFSEVSMQRLTHILTNPQTPSLDPDGKNELFLTA